MFKTVITSIALFGALAGASVATSTTASAGPFCKFGCFHPVFPVGGIHPVYPIHPIGPIIDPIPPHHHHPHGPGFGFGITIADDGYNYAPDYVSCGEAKSIVRGNGFHAVQTQDCSGGVYTFTGLKHGASFSIDISNHGRILGVDHIWSGRRGGGGKPPPFISNT